jgi:hypothetical protein
MLHVKLNFYQTVSSITSGIIATLNLFSSTLPEPYTSVQILPEYHFSYYVNEQQISELFDKNDIRVVVEVGSWIGGGSTRHMGELLKKHHGILYAVDTWLGSSTQQFGEVHYQPILAQVYEQFLSNMIHWNLTDIVVPCRMTSLNASKVLKVQPDLIYIDAEHTTEAVYEDLVAWYPFVKDRGIFCGDDWSWASVRVAVEHFANENNLLIDVSGNLWVLRKR